MPSESTQLVQRTLPSSWLRRLVPVVVIAVIGSITFLHSTVSTSPKRLHGSTKLNSAVRNGLDDPEEAVPAFTFLALGDWGGTLGKAAGYPGSCCKLYRGALDTGSSRFKVDYYAQIYVAALMAQSADEIHPLRILSHGDNFYWSGVGTGDMEYRFDQTFERVYNAPSLRDVPWLNVAGNHDLGGNSFICGEADYAFRECQTKEELLRYLDIRFEAQANYTSPHKNRWILRDHYYVERVAKDGVSVDVFNLDTNHAEHHGAKDVCCQCFDYAKRLHMPQSVCNTIRPGDAACFGGNLELYDACVAKIESWANDSWQRAMVDIQASTATFKIVNTHYSPHYHMEVEKRNQWYTLCREAGVTVWFNGHTHGFNHDIATWGTHFFENGGGGGYWTQNFPGMNNGFVKNQWRVVGNPYGFMELSFSKDWLKVQFVTFDRDWDFGGLDLAKSHIGGIQRGHCWFIPRTFRESSGVECRSSVNGAIGAPLQGELGCKI